MKQHSLMIHCHLDCLVLEHEVAVMNFFWRKTSSLKKIRARAATSFCRFCIDSVLNILCTPTNPSKCRTDKNPVHSGCPSKTRSTTRQTMWNFYRRQPETPAFIHSLNDNRILS
jgi:hypothetical protein